MKRRSISLILVLLVVLSVAASSFAATLTTKYSGNALRVFTPSAYLQRSSSDNSWTWVQIYCTKSYYYAQNDDAEKGDHSYPHILKVFNASGGAAADDVVLWEHTGTEHDYEIVYPYSSQANTTKITFKVYNYYYHNYGTQDYKLSCAANLIGHLG